MSISTKRYIYPFQGRTLGSCKNVTYSRGDTQLQSDRKSATASITLYGFNE